MLRQNGRRLIGAVLSCCLILTCLTACSSDSAAQSAADSSDTAAGLAYLQSLDQLDLASIDAALAWQHEHNLEEKRTELLTQLDNGEISCWSLFEDYLLCGDSRFVGISYDGFLPESNVWAESGTTISSLQSMIPDIVTAAPARLFLDYGMNDFCSGDWNDPVVWAQSYADIIRDLQSQLPNLKVYVCSIIPATDALTASESLWTIIPNYNTALADALSNMDRTCFIDCTELADTHQDLYQSDGKHFTEEFYQLWGRQMILAMFDYEFDDGISESSGSEAVEAPSASSAAAAVPSDADPADNSAAGSNPTG